MERRRARIAVLAVLVSLASCTSLSVTTTGAMSADELRAEDDYIALYTDQLTRYSQDLEAYASVGSEPGPCDKGGNATECVAADQQSIKTLASMRQALESANVPARFTDANRLLGEALDETIVGLELRDQSLVTVDDELWATDERSSKPNEYALPVRQLAPASVQTLLRSNTLKHMCSFALSFSAPASMQS